MSEVSRLDDNSFKIEVRNFKEVFLVKEEIRDENILLLHVRMSWKTWGLTNWYV